MGKQDLLSTSWALPTELLFKAIDALASSSVMSKQSSINDFFSRLPRQSRRAGRRGGGGDRGNTSTRRNRDLANVAKETRDALPDILRQISSIDATYSERHTLDALPVLDGVNCPRHAPISVKVVNQDTFNAAIDLAAAVPNGGRVVVLNLASDVRAGGGWLKGAMAQEEALCYRSSLSLSLHRRYYPFPDAFTGLYTPDVVVIRGDVPSGHQLLVPHVAPGGLPVVSVLSIAALRNPETTDVSAVAPKGSVQRRDFAKVDDRRVTKGKMRLCLRMAASKGHQLLVLGALGCGAFNNPVDDVAMCWREVLDEAEFGGGWWKAVVFAVLDRRGEGNFGVFKEVLEGAQV